MSNQVKTPKKATIHDFFIKVVGVLKLHELEKYERFNLISSAIIAVVALALSLPPVLALVNNIIISIGNIIIVVSEKYDHTQSPNNSVGVTIILPLLIVLGESIVCKIMCCLYKKINK